MKKKILLSVLLFCVSVVLFLLPIKLKHIHIDAISLIGSGLHLIVTTAIFFIWTLLALKYFVKNLSAASIVWIIIAGASLIEFIIRIIDFQDTLISLPDFIFRILAIVAAYLFYRSKSVVCRIATVVLTCILVLYFAFCGYSMWGMKLNFGTFNGRVETPVSRNIGFDTVDGRQVKIGEFGNRYVILDFWHSTCGACYRVFPKVQSLYDELQGSERAALYSVHCRVEGEHSFTGRDILAERKYSFPVLSIDRKSSVIDHFGIRAYPTIIILDPDGDIIFRGRIEEAKDYINEILS